MTEVELNIQPALGGFGEGSLLGPSGCCMAAASGVSVLQQEGVLSQAVMAHAGSLCWR